MLAGLDPYQHLYAHRTGSFRSSAMRDLMAITSGPEVISLAGGLPDTKAFPPELLHELVDDVTTRDGPRALQYGPTEGLDELRHAIADLMAEDGTLVGAAELIVTTGGQQALDLLCRVLVDPGDAVLAEGPTYPGAVPVFAACGADVHHVAVDAEGIRVDLLADAVERLAHEGRSAKFLYVIPTFQNPAGTTMSLGRRREVVRFAQEHDLLVVEDEPYARLRFEGDALPEPALARRHRPRAVRRHGVEGVRARRPRRLGARTAPDPAPREPREAGLRPLHVDVRAAARAAVPAPRRAATRCSTACSSSTGRAATRW